MSVKISKSGLPHPEIPSSKEQRVSSAAKVVSQPDCNAIALHESALRQPLTREDWNFSALPPDQYRAALRWEILRECPDVVDVVADARAWLDGKVTDARPPSRKAGRCGKPIRPFSEVDRVRTRTTSVFRDFIPIHEFLSYRQTKHETFRSAYHSWLLKLVRPLVDNYGLPWLRLPPEERCRLSTIGEQIRRARAVQIASLSEVLSVHKRNKLDKNRPLVLDSQFAGGETTLLLLRIERSHPIKQILAGINAILKESKPAGAVVPSHRRGKKNRDLLVALERIGIMRLLHHHTLSELRIKLPQAVTLYANKDWYEERRKGLKGFRRRAGYSEPQDPYPASWETRASSVRSRKDALRNRISVGRARQNRVRALAR